jgi:Tfp pilus assembly protein FimT
MGDRIIIKHAENGDSEQSQSGVRLRFSRENAGVTLAELLVSLIIITIVIYAIINFFSFKIQNN